MGFLPAFIGWTSLSVVVMVVQGQSTTCPTTPRDQAGPFYVPNSPLSSMLTSVDLLSNVSKRLIVNGRVLGSNCSPLATPPTVEAWYAGEADENGNLYQDENYRGQVVTDACGRYQFNQTFPSQYTGRPIHIHFRVSVDEQELLITQLYFTGLNPPVGRELQTVAVNSMENGERNVEFNIVVPKEGTANASCDDVTIDVSPGGDTSNESPSSPNGGGEEPSPASTTTTSGGVEFVQNATKLLFSLLVVAMKLTEIL